jgi:hypothetical protein
MPGRNRAAPTVPTPPVADGRVADGQRRGRRGQERVPAHVHRGRTRVRRLPAEGHPVAFDADRSGHGADRQALPFQHRPLLNVRLQVSLGATDLLPRLVQAIQVDAVLGDHITEPQPSGIGKLADFGHVQRSRHGGRAKQAVPESGAFLVRPFHQRERARQRPARRQSAQDLHRAHDAVGAVEPAAVRDRVQVRADDHDPAAATRQPCPLVARRVRTDSHWEAPAVAPARMRAPFARHRSRRPAGARLVARQLRQFAQHRHDAGPVRAGVLVKTRTRHCPSFSPNRTLAQQPSPKTVR